MNKSAYEKNTYPTTPQRITHAAKLTVKRSPLGPLLLAVKHSFQKSPCHRALSRGRRLGWHEAAIWLLSDKGRPILSDPGLLRQLAERANEDIESELLFTHVRKIVMLDNELPVDEVLVDFCVALTKQLIINEHVFFVGEEERNRITALTSDAGPSVDTEQEWTRFALRLCLYLPDFAQQPASDAVLRAAKAAPSLRQLIEQTRQQVQEEQQLIIGTKSTESLANETSSLVQKQYEEHPYPRWIRIDPPFLVSGHLHNMLARHLSPNELARLDKSADVLIAGCGTGRHALVSVIGYGSAANAIAVDLSMASLSYAQRKAREIGVTNIDFRQLDILKIDELGKQFEIVECVGTLHHMADPLAGWRALTGVLKPGGFMRIGLYSEAARREDTLLPDEPHNKVVDSDEIREFRHKILTEEPERLDGGYCPLRRDFWYLSRCRDLVFHSMEHRFTIRRIKANLAELGLEFRGFERVELPANKYWASFPRGDQRFDLDAWSKFEEANPQSFGNLYKFWCSKPKV